MGGVLLIDVYKILIGDGINVLWFLSTLVLSEIIFDVLYQIITKYMLAASFLFSICGSFLYIFLAKNINSHAIVILLQVIGRPLFVLPFFYLGSLLKKNMVIERIKEKNKPVIHMTIYIGLLVVVYFLSNKNGIVDIHEMKLGRNIFVTYITSMLGLVSTIGLSAELGSNSIFVNLLKFFGCNSIVIMVTHNEFGIINVLGKSIAYLGLSQLTTDFLVFGCVMLLELVFVKYIGIKSDVFIKGKASN